jgi:hypothetical protein
MDIRDVIRSQYLASLAMLEQAIAKCPESSWDDRAYRNQFWHIAYHVLFYTHLYLQPTREDFVPWEKHRDGLESLGPESGEPYARDEILAYYALCREQVKDQVAALDLEAGSGFFWLPMNKLELQFYNVRHLQHHTGELCERLGARGAVEVDWIGMERKDRAPT